jgi:hypothetical protein
MKSYMTHIPSGAGYKDFMHYGQFINSKQFQRYDYGEEENMKIYGQKTAPLCPLENIKDFPIALFAGTLDELADPKDVDWLAQTLGKNVIFYH